MRCDDQLRFAGERSLSSLSEIAVFFSLRSSAKTEILTPGPPDDTTPIRRPSYYYGRRHNSSMKGFFPKEKANVDVTATAAPPLAPAARDSLIPNRIDKSQLAIGEPKRLRDKAHLKFVASQPCLICGRQPSDPHHLRFAQPRAYSLPLRGD